MNKYLMLSAAALLATTAGADAGTVVASFGFYTVYGSGFCDGGIVYTNGAAIWSWRHTDCSRPDTYGQGLVGRSKAVRGGSVNMSDTLVGQNYGIFSEYLSYTLPAKLKTGQSWEAWIGIGGTTSFLANYGYIVVADKLKYRTGKRTTDVLKQLIQAHRPPTKD